MPVQPSYPGSYVEEVTSRRKISPVSTGIAMFVGCCTEGPFDKPTQIFSFQGFEKTFGPGSNYSENEMALQVKMFFNNGGSSAYVMRLRLGATASSVPVYANAFKSLEDIHVDWMVEFDLLILPRMQADRYDVAMVIQEQYEVASKFVEKCGALLLMDPPVFWENVENMYDYRPWQNNDNFAMDHCAVYWPRVNVRKGSQLQTIGPCGTVAGIMARTDASRGVWKAAAGLEADVRGIKSLEHPLTNVENGVLNTKAINAIRAFPQSTVAWGARTLGGYDGAECGDFKYVPVRRTATMIEKSLQEGLRFTEYEENNEALWAQVRLAAGSFMHRLWRQGAFKGEKASDAYFVKIDGQTTNTLDRDLGLAKLVVGFAPLKPADFVALTLDLRTKKRVAE